MATRPSPDTPRREKSAMWMEPTPELAASYAAQAVSKTRARRRRRRWLIVAVSLLGLVVAASADARLRCYKIGGTWLCVHVP